MGAKNIDFRSICRGGRFFPMFHGPISREIADVPRPNRLVKSPTQGATNRAFVAQATPVPRGRRRVLDRGPSRSLFGSYAVALAGRIGWISCCQSLLAPPASVASGGRLAECSACFSGPLAAQVTPYLRDIDGLCACIDEAPPAPKRPKFYRQRGAGENHEKRSVPRRRIAVVGIAGFLKEYPTTLFRMPSIGPVLLVGF